MQAGNGLRAQGLTPRPRCRNRRGCAQGFGGYEAFEYRSAFHRRQAFTIAYSPRRAGTLAKHFFDRHPDIPGCPIVGMSKDQVHDALSLAMIYVEFSHNPGNDRMPREAACVGCIVLAKAAGGSAYFEDMPLDDIFKFEEQDVTSGKLAGLIKAIARDPVLYFEAQDFYRRHLYLEKEQMMLQVRRLLLAT